MKQPPKVILPKLKLDRCPECKVKAGQQHKLNCALLIKSHPIQSYILYYEPESYIGIVR